ncbi:hypothetical protein T01_14877 [Trichinella spiralis]|uniref:Uncharacterized protein n=1 Tax=Trichinella spiralis TaxID=6334 RepID=A0A0V1C022_TRISP|nr:hypothetical protein T01_14877 [Trichinella spiralis]
MKESGLPEAEPLAGRTISHLVPSPHPLQTSPESRRVDDSHLVTCRIISRESSVRTILKEGGSLRRMDGIIPAHLTDFFVGQCTIGHAESQLLTWLLFRYLGCHCCIPLPLIANSSKVSVQNRLLISIDLKKQNYKSKLLLQVPFAESIAHRCLRQCHPGPYPSCSQKFESYCLCKRSRKNIPCLLMNAPVLYHKHFFYKNSAKHKNALPIASHVTCLIYTFKCNRRCKLILDCGKHQCKKKCCTKLKHQCFTVCTRLLAVACTFAIGLVIRADAIRVSWNWFITLLSRAENELKCNQQCENTRKNDAFISVLGLECLNVSQLSLNYSRRNEQLKNLSKLPDVLLSKCIHQNQNIKSITVRQGKQQKPTRLDPPRPDVPLTHQGHQVQCDWLT